MKSELKKVFWCVAAGIVATTAISLWLESYRNGNAARELEETRHTLRAKGFKTDFSDFDFKTGGSARSRAAALMGHDWIGSLRPPVAWMKLMPEVSPDTATIIWKKNWVSAKRGSVDWSDFHSALDPHREALDNACSAAISGPIRFEPEVSDGEDVWGETTAQLRCLMELLSARTMLELHDGSQEAAWTNLMAVTRVVTAWEPEPEESAHIFHAGFAEIAFAITWQALQCGNWPDAKLAALQRAWESVNFFTNLPDTAAFHRVKAIYRSRWMAIEPLANDFSISEVARETFQNPAQAWADVRDAVNLESYRGREQMNDEKNLLLYFRNRELELRHAIQSTTWVDMRSQPGVTNVPVFGSPYQPMLEYMGADVLYRRSMLAGAADAEARRRVIIVAIALERCRVQHGSYPATLTALAPEFLKSVPVDFINDQSLHYRLAGDGHFVLYSVGLDGVDDGGKLPVSIDLIWAGHMLSPLGAVTNDDIVWPRPDAGTQAE